MLEQTASLEARRSWKLYLFLFRFPLFGVTIYLVAELLEWHWELITLPTLTLPSAVFLKSISLLSGRITISVLTELIREERMQMSVIFAGRGMMGFGQISSTEMVSTILLVTVIHQLISSPSWPNQFPVDQFLTIAPVCVCVWVYQQQACNRVLAFPLFWEACGGTPSAWRSAPGVQMVGGAA